jgi:hypothetical protein
MIRPMFGLASLVMMAAWALPASAQPAPKKAPNKPTGAALRVQITMDQLQCLKTTERGNQADEVYMIVAGKSPAGTFKKRLPDAKNNYLFKAGQKAGATGWKTKDGKERGRPVLFAGSLKPGELVQLTVMMIEQDKGNSVVDKAKGVVDKAKKAGGGLLGGVVKKIGGAAGGVAKKIGGVAGGVAKKAGSVVKQVTGVVDKVSGALEKVNEISGGLLGGQAKALGVLNKTIQKAREVLKGDGDDYIGGVTVVVKNENGRLRVKYIPGKETKEIGKGQFDMTASGAQYKATLNAK